MHPSLVPTLEVIRDGREIICVRSYVQGADLTRIAHGYHSAGEAFPLSGAMVILSELLKALHYLQSSSGQGKGEPEDWLHGGITPRNLFVESNGNLQITGFGFGELGIRGASVEAWKNRRMSAMSPRWIAKGHLEQEEDLFAAGALIYGLLMKEGVYGTPDTSSPEELLNLVRGWGGIDSEALALRTRSKSIAAVLKRLTSAKAGANFGGAREALLALDNVVPNWSENEKRVILEGMLDGSVKDGDLVSEGDATSPTVHPLGEGGATRTILDGGHKREAPSTAQDNSSTLRGASTESLGEDFQSVKKNFGVLKDQKAQQSGRGGVVRRPEVRPKLRKSSDASKHDVIPDKTLDVDGAQIFAGMEGTNGQGDSTLELDQRQIFPQGIGGGREDLPTSNTPAPQRGELGAIIGQDDRTLDLDGARIFQEKRSQTVLRVKTPAPSTVFNTRDEAGQYGADGARQDSRINFGKAVLADRLPPISESATFRLLVMALGVLFLLLGLLVFLWIRKMDVLQVASTETAQAAVVQDMEQETSLSPPLKRE